MFTGKNKLDKVDYRKFILFCDYIINENSYSFGSISLRGTLSFWLVKKCVFNKRFFCEEVDGVGIVECGVIGRVYWL